MNESRQLPVAEPTDRTTITLLIGGETLSSEYQLLSVSIQKAANRIPWATLTLADGDPALGDFLLSSSETMLPGQEIEILAGYHSAEETVFKGVIVAQGIRARDGKAPVIIVKCRDVADQLTAHSKSAYYLEKTDSDVIAELLGDAGLDNTVEATEVNYPNMVRAASTDWDFLLSRAEANGHLVLVDDGAVTVGPPDTANTSDLTLTYGATLLAFEAEVDARNQVVSVASRAWDPSSQEVLEGAGEEPSVVDQGDLSASELAAAVFEAEEVQQHTGARSEQELSVWASARLLKSRMSKVQGRAKCQGFSTVKPGQVVTLQGLGSRFSGDAYVAAIRHEITSRSWETHLQFGINAEWFHAKETISAPPASGLVPAMHGLQIGIVTQVGEDPDGEERVRVRMPLVDAEEDGIWARVASLDAGEDRGAFFRPELNDEVVLGFLSADPRDPVILGMLNSSAKAAPLVASDDNHEKGFITRSGLKLIFNDDAPSVALETPGGNKWLLTDDAEEILLEDQHGNKLLMNADGMTLESASDIHLSAAGDIVLEGTNIELNASAELKGAGAAGAEISSSGTTKISGALVQIN